MSVATLDTHEIAKNLPSAGFTAEQAEAFARNLRKARDLDFSALATKADVEAVRTEAETVRGKIGDAKSESLKWTFRAIGLQTLIILGTVIKPVTP